MVYWIIEWPTVLPNGDIMLWPLTMTDSASSLSSSKTEPPDSESAAPSAFAATFTAI